MTVARADPDPGSLRHALDRIKAGCMELERVSEWLDKAAGRSTDKPSPSTEDLVGKVVSALVTHYEASEAREGCLIELLHLAPELSGEIRLLQTEHGALTSMARDIVAELRQMSGPEARGRLAADMQRLSDMITEHRVSTMDLTAQIERRFPSV